MTEERIQQLVSQALAFDAVSDPRGQIEMTVRQAIKEARDDVDGERYRWLRPRFYGADFAYGSPPAYIISFRMDNDVKVIGDLDATIDAMRSDNSPR